MSSEVVIRDQLASAEALLSVVGTMKTLAAVRTNKYRRAVAALHSSARTLDLAWRATVKMHPDLLPTFMNSEEGALAVVVFGSERGLCGGFNERVARHTAGMLRQLAPDGDNTVVFPVGRRVRARLRRMGVKTVEGAQLPGSLDAIDRGVAQVLAQIDNWRAERHFGHLYFVYNRPLRGTDYKPLTLQLLPLDEAWLRGLRERPWPAKGLPVAIMEPVELLGGVIRQSIALALERAFTSSMASENSARLVAMEAAERNVEERLDALRVQHRALRQNAITDELLDIQAAYAAMEDTPA